MRPIGIVLAIAAIEIGLCGLAVTLWNRSASFLAETWHEELEHAPDHQVDAIPDRLAELDDADRVTAANDQDKAVARVSRPVSDGSGEPSYVLSNMTSELTEPKALRRSDESAPMPPAAEVPKPLHSSPASPQANAPSGVSVDSTSAASNAPRRLPPVRRAELDDRRSHEASAGAGSCGDLDLGKLALSLHDRDPRQVEAARRELKRRGLSAVEIELAERLTHPDAAVRKKLAQTLPDAVGVDAAAWLLELSRDPDADVRLEAMTLLATTGDPTLLDALRKLVETDSDPRIQRLSARLSRASLLPDQSRARGAAR